MSGPENPDVFQQACLGKQGSAADQAALPEATVGVPGLFSGEGGGPPGPGSPVLSPKTPRVWVFITPPWLEKWPCWEEIGWNEGIKVSEQTT